MRVARPVTLTEEERGKLESWARGRSLAARWVERAKVVLMAADGARDKEISAKLRITPEKAARWRNRFADLGLAGLEKDAPRRTPARRPNGTVPPGMRSSSISSRAVSRGSRRKGAAPDS